MRLDKFLKVSHIIKRRTLAKECSDKGCISINGRTAKASTEVNVGDSMEIRMGFERKKYVIKEIREFTNLESASEMYEEID